MISNKFNFQSKKFQSKQFSPSEYTIYKIYIFCLNLFREKLCECEQRLITSEQKTNNHLDFENDVEDNMNTEINRCQSYDDSLESSSKIEKSIVLKIEIGQVNTFLCFKKCFNFYIYSMFQKFDRNIGIEFYFEPIKKCESKEGESEDQYDVGKIFVSKIKENSSAYGKLKFVKYLRYSTYNL